MNKGTKIIGSIIESSPLTELILLLAFFFFAFFYYLLTENCYIGAFIDMDPPPPPPSMTDLVYTMNEIL